MGSRYYCLSFYLICEKKLKADSYGFGYEFVHPFKELVREHTSNMETISQEIRSLWSKITEKENELHEIKEVLHRKQEELKVICGNNGHDFQREDDGDYHRPRYYYRCRCCNHITYSLARS